MIGEIIACETSQGRASTSGSAKVAVDALAAAYKSKDVFEHIRAPLSRGYEYLDMPEVAGESESGTR